MEIRLDSKYGRRLGREISFFLEAGGKVNVIFFYMYINILYAFNINMS